VGNITSKLDACSFVRHRTLVMTRIVSAKARRALGGTPYGSERAWVSKVEYQSRGKVINSNPPGAVSFAQPSTFLRHQMAAFFVTDTKGSHFLGHMMEPGVLHLYLYQRGHA